MLTAVIKGPDPEREIEEAMSYADAFEFRLDHFSTLDHKKIKSLKEKAKAPVIFTLRRRDQGGEYAGGEDRRLLEIEKLASLLPDFIDLEYDVPLEFFKKMRDLFPGIQLIVSCHDFEKTPQDLSHFLQKMRKPFFAIYKIACMAKSSADLLRLLRFVKERAKEEKIIGISMGEHGSPSRILSKIAGNFLQYASNKKEEGALHQMTLQEMQEIYRYRDVNESTRIYALLGDPVMQSVGHIFHNRLFRERKINAVYVKCRVSKEDLAEFFKELGALPFDGFSVTMPLKEAVIPFLAHLDPDSAKIQAVNTICREKGGMKGFNTDAPGALDAVEAFGSVRGKKLVLLGAGGAAKAIAYEALKRGSEVIIANRSLEKGEMLAQELGCGASSVEEIEVYDILVNGTSLGMNGELAVPEKFLVKGAVVMDTVYHPQETPLLQAARKAGCRCVYGIEMFHNQALLQQKIWNP
jgi:3-dehydroquinate dehydratase / shikimate dehydrogenase